MAIKSARGINSLPAVNNDVISRFDFATLGPELILDALLQLGLDVSSGLLALNSYENRVYQFTAYPDQSLQPQKYVVKFYRPERWSPQQIQEEHDFAFELAEADIPMVAPLRFDGASLLQYQGYYFAVFPSRGGRTLEVDNDEQLAMLGRFLGRMHQVGAKKTFSSRPTFSVNSHLLQSQQVLAKLQLIPDYMRPAFDTVLQQVIAEASRQYQPGRQIRLHGDCHAGNLFYVDQGPFFVDLDDCRTGPAIQDIWMMLSGDQQEQRLTLELMLEEYEQYCDFDPAELKLIEPLRAMRIVHYMAWLARRWQDQAFVQSFPWFATDKYWEQQCLVLKEQLALLQQPPLSLVPGY
ncbi:Ser/Thr protein kinase RdoA involved in Cpx stress response, MazF antagonist [Arsukibacterium tuosuense]|uniref:Stress response kinase A n=1 Tax=Arsukibacterium tuosuense TaxID=1323745 RepID=A0A285IMJ8_9GAMM|nr:Ser/Thr protein kinase RdoA involved in Cpx stress response, MazF antagonist [Arsukibacterium tuosuense]